MTVRKRPLSPHLQIYRLPLTGLISITHRITGVLLVLYLLFCTLLCVGIAVGEPVYLRIQAAMQLPLIGLLSWAGLLALCVHLCHGVRHLFWDLGESFDRARLQRYAVYELLAAAGLFLIFVIILST